MPATSPNGSLRRRMRQLDLFHDSPRTIVLNVLREAIVARNALEAGIAFERLLNLDPGHEMASDAGTLIAILETPAPEGPDEGIEWLHALEQEWRPAAVRLLGTGDGRDFLAPVWRCIGGALRPAALRSRPSRTPRELGLPARAGLGGSETFGARRAGARNDAGAARAAGGSGIPVGRLHSAPSTWSNSIPPLRPPICQTSFVLLQLQLDARPKSSTAPTTT